MAYTIEVRALSEAEIDLLFDLSAALDCVPIDALERRGHCREDARRLEVLGLIAYEGKQFDADGGFEEGYFVTDCGFSVASAIRRAHDA